MTRDTPKDGPDSPARQPRDAAEKEAQREVESDPNDEPIQQHLETPRRRRVRTTPRDANVSGK